MILINKNMNMKLKMYNNIHWKFHFTDIVFHKKYSIIYESIKTKKHSKISNTS